MSRRGKQQRGTKNTILRIQYGEPDESEQRAMDTRLNQLLHPTEAQEEEVAEGNIQVATENPPAETEEQPAAATPMGT